jgi:hypothetical protein
MVTNELEGLSLSELFAQYGAILRELRRREVVRTNDAPAGGWAEYLVCKYLGGTPAPNSEKSWDVLAPDQSRVQVKARVVFDTSRVGQRQLSSFRSFSFDTLAVVLFDDMHAVWRAVLLPVGEVQKRVRPTPYVAGHRLMATDALLNAVTATDITEGLRRIATAPGMTLIPGSAEPSMAPSQCAWCETEKTSTRRLEAQHRRECPFCDHVFKGHGWDGIDAHWRSRHEGGMKYQSFWNSLCDHHRGR